MNMTISKKIKYFYWFFTLGIVIFHSYEPTEFKLVTMSKLDKFVADFYPIFADRLGHIALTFFFFMSAFWLYNNTNTAKDCLTKIKKRLLSLLVPYLIWTLFLAMLKIFMNELTIIEFLKKIYIYTFFKPIIGVSWYILSLLLLIAIYPPLSLIAKNKTISFLVFSILILYFSIIKYFEIPYIVEAKDWWWYDNMLFYIPIYLLGGFIGLNYPYIVLEKEYNKNRYIFIGAFLVILSILLFYLFQIRKFYVIFSTICLIGFWFLFKNTLFIKKQPKIFDAEFFIFILHQPIMLPIIRIIIQKVLPISAMNGFEMIIIKLITLTLVVVFSYLLRWGLVKILPRKVFNLLSGGR